MRPPYPRTHARTLTPPRHATPWHRIAQHVPTAAGRYNLKVRLYKPVASSLLQQLISWANGMPPEFVDPRFPTQTEGREVVRAKSTGYAIVSLNVMTRNMEHFGYATGAGPAKADGLVVV